MRLNYLDSLKGIGAMIVLLSHYYLAFNVGVYELPLFSEYSPMNLFINGNWAVCLFIILSSFSIVYSLEEKGKSCLKDIIIKRYFRLSIPIAFVLLLIYILYVCGLFYNDLVSSLIDNFWLSYFYCKNISFVDFVKECIYVVLTGESELNSPLWMINYIFIGTFVIILLRIAMEGMSCKKKILILFVLALFLLKISVYYSCIICGYILYNLYLSNSLENRYIIFFVKTISLLAFILFPILIKNPLSNMISAFSLLYLVFNSHFLQRLLSNKYTIFLGKISYHLYLVHWPIICSISCFLFVEIFNVNELLSYMIAFFSSILISVLFAWKITERVEPMYNLLIKKIVILLS